MNIPEQLTDECFKILNDALDRKPKILVIKQKDSNIFNHGAPIDDSDDTRSCIDRFLDLSTRLMNTSAICIVIIKGSVRGGGMLFPAIADICIASRESTFGLPEIHRQMVPGVVSSALNKKIQHSKVKYYSLTGEPFDSKTAIELGLVDTLYNSESVRNLLRRIENNSFEAGFIKKKFTHTNPISTGVLMGEWFDRKSKKYDLTNKLETLQLHTDKYENIGVLTMCDNEYKNTFTDKMSNELTMLLPTLRKYKVIILKSSLENFHVGANPFMLSRWFNLPKVTIAYKMKELYSSFIELFKLGIPIISILNGRVYGGGLPLALWSDYRIATSDLDFHYGNITRGMSPAAQLSEMLNANLHLSSISEFYLENSHWDAYKCKKEGVVNIICDDTESAFREALRLARFISKQKKQGVNNTLKLIKPDVSEEIINIEAWYIAEACHNGNVFTNVRFQNESFNKLITNKSNITDNKTIEIEKNNDKYGIIEIEPVVPMYYIDAEETEKLGVEAKSKYLQKANAIWDINEDAVSLAMTALRRMLRKFPNIMKDVGRLEVGTESSTDIAKSIKSYLMSMEELKDFPDLLGCDNINACYGGTAALLNTIDWLYSGRTKYKYGIVVITDVANMNVESIAWQGGGAIAILIGPNPSIEILTHPVSYMKNTDDFLKPRYSTQITPYMKGKKSMDSYLAALDYTIQHTNQQHKQDLDNSDYILLHGGLCKSVTVNAMNHLGKQYKISRKEIMNKYIAGTIHGEYIGGLYTGSLYFSLHSLLEHATDIENKKILMFSYGSGCCSTMMRAIIHKLPKYFEALTPSLEKRTPLNKDIVDKIIKKHIDIKSKFNIDIEETLPKVNDRFYLEKIPSEDSMRMYYYYS